MKPKDKILTYAQAKELRWFNKNCTGTRLEFYKLLEEMETFRRKLDRLLGLGNTIESYFKDQFEELDRKEAEDFKKYTEFEASK